MFARKSKPVEMVIESDEVGHRDFESVDRIQTEINNNVSNASDYEAATQSSVLLV